jgi:hypothetical protein
VGKGALRAVPTIIKRKRRGDEMVGTPSGAHSRAPLALPTLRATADIFRHFDFRKAKLLFN